MPYRRLRDDSRPARSLVLLGGRNSVSVSTVCSQGSLLIEVLFYVARAFAEFEAAPTWSLQGVSLSV